MHIDLFIVIIVAYPKSCSVETKQPLTQLGHEIDLKCNPFSLSTIQVCMHAKEKPSAGFT